MIDMLAKNQNWAKATPVMGVVCTILLFIFLEPSSPMFWALINIPLYLFHQCEEHFIPGGFKDFINQKMFKLTPPEEKLTDIKVFWINILFVWVAFAVFGALAFINIGFGLLIIVFSIINCLTHIAQGIKLKSYNPGLVVASMQFLLSLYAAYFITTTTLSNPIFWWIFTVAFSIVSHIILFKSVMSK